MRRVFNLVAGFLVSRRTLVTAVEQRTNERDNACANAVRMREQRDEFAVEVVRLRADLAVARKALAWRLSRDADYWAPTLRDIESL